MFSLMMGLEVSRLSFDLCWSVGFASGFVEELPGGLTSCANVQPPKEQTRQMEPIRFTNFTVILPPPHLCNLKIGEMKVFPRSVWDLPVLDAISPAKVAASAFIGFRTTSLFQSPNPKRPNRIRANDSSAASPISTRLPVCFLTFLLMRHGRFPRLDVAARRRTLRVR